MKKLISAVMVRGSGSIGNFVVLLMTIRLFGPEAAGVLFNVLAIGYTSAILANLGLSRFVLRALPRTTDEPDLKTALIGQVQLLILIMALGLCTIGAVSLYVVSAQTFDANAETRLWLTGATLGMLLGSALLFLLGTADVLKAQGRVGIAIFVEISAFPWLSALGLGVSYFSGISATLLPAFASIGSAFIICLIALWRLKDVTWGPIVAAPPGRLARSAAFLYAQRHTLTVYWASGILVMVSSRMTGLIAPLFLLPAEAGFVAALVGIASLGGTIISAAQAYFAPRFSSLHHAQETASLQTELRTSQAVVGGLFAVIAIPVMLFPEHALSFFGSEAAAFPRNLLIIATGAQLLRCFAGCSEIFLTMTSRAGLETGTLLLAILVFWLVLLFGGGSGLGIFVYAYCAMLVTRGVFSYAASIYELNHWKSNDI